MATRHDTVWLLLPRQLRELPADLAAVVLGVVCTLGSVFLPIIKDTPLRVVFGLAFVLFLPGYAFIAALFPEAGEPPETDDASPPTAPEPDPDASAFKPAPEPGTSAAEDAPETTNAPSSATSHDRSGIDGIERVALSFGLSIAIVPLIGLILNFTPWGIRLASIALTVSLFTLASVAVASSRRHDLPPEDRFRIPYETWITDARNELFNPDSRTDAALNVLLALSILLAVSSVGYAVAVPKEGESFSEFYLLTEDDDGELVADGYPTDITIDDRPELIVGIGNQEHEPMNYTVVVQLQSVTTEGNTTTVQSRTEIDRFTASVAHNETAHQRRTLTPTQTGENLRVKYLLYRGDAPPTPTAETAYRDLHLWMNVSSA